MYANRCNIISHHVQNKGQRWVRHWLAGAARHATHVPLTLPALAGMGPGALVAVWKKKERGREKRTCRMGMANSRRKMQIALQLLLFQAVEGPEMGPLGGQTLEWTLGTC